MAKVYLARDLKHDRPVALKVLRPDLAHALGSDRFTREIRVVARLQDPNIVTVLDSGDDAGQLWYTMPFVEGESLRARLDREGALPVDEAIALTREIAGALETAHAAGIVHRDVKPENILVSHGRGLLADFGIAKAAAGAEARLTETGLSLGTPAYMSPEQASADPHIDHRSDQYGLACVLYEMLAGEAPFTGPNVQAVIAKRLTGPAPSVRIARTTVPAHVDATLARAMAMLPGDRFASVAEFSRALVAPARASGARIPLPRVAIGLALVAVAALLMILTRTRRGPDTVPSAAAAAPGSLAILPFANIGGDTAEAYFADGMADELTTALARVPGLRVAARSSANRYRDRQVEPAEVARALGVAAVLEGSVRRAADRLRVSVRLSDGADGLVIWADTYERESADVFAVQDEIASAVATAIGSRLGSAPGSPVSGTSAMAPRGTADLEAYDLYLKGRFAWSKRGERGLRDAIGWFDRAVARDPAFARGHAGLAMAWVVLPVFTTAVRVDTALAHAERSATRALALDSTLADAHLALAYLLKSRWRFAEAEPHFRSALALAPDDPGVRHWYGVHLYVTGRPEESVVQLRRAAELDPFASTIATDGAFALYAARRYDEALAEVRRARAMDTTRSDVPLVAGIIQLARGHADSALEGLAAARRLGTGMEVRGYTSAALRMLGRTGDADSLLAELARDEAAGRADPFDLAVAAAAAGNRAVALAALERTMARRSIFVTEVTLPCEPIFDPLRSDPRFVAALGRAGMAACTTGR